MNVLLPDGSTKVVAEGATVYDVAASIGAGLAKASLAGKINGQLAHLTQEVCDGDAIEIITQKSPEALDLLRHSTAHVMAAAVEALFDHAQFGVGPAIEDGFYYDIEVGRAFSPEDLERITAKMNELIAADLPFVREEVTKEEALARFASQPLKCELIEELDDAEVLTIYSCGDFCDLCRGPHLPSTGKIKAFKLTKLAGAYWRGDANREMLQRIYGTAWFTKNDLEAYLTRIEEAEKRDHRKLAKQLGIYAMYDEAGPGLPLFLPAGAKIVRTMQEWLRKELINRCYEEVITPHIYKADVWKTSGHYFYYHDDMYFFEVNEGEGPVQASPEEMVKSGAQKVSEFGVKPMNCPGHVLLYRANLHSYREMPVRFFEFGTVYRHEMSGVVHGLFRARGFTQDDAHVFCRPDQVVDEVVDILDLVNQIMSTFDLTYTAEISTRPEKSIGTDEMWEHATDALKQAIERHGMDYEINEGDGAFYGPKIDIKVRDSIGRTWQCSTIQVDFNLPERFNLTYRTADNSEARPVMLHRAIFGSIERFLGILIEHYAGSLPAWLAPVQVQVIPIADRHLDYAYEVANTLRRAGGRVEVATQNEPMRVKIAKAQDQKIPYMLVVGDKEQESLSVSVRERGAGDTGTQTLADFVKVIEAARI